MTRTNAHPPFDLHPNSTSMRILSSFQPVVLGCLLLLASMPAPASDPHISNVRASQRTDLNLVDIIYDMTDPDSASVNVSVQISTNGGSTYDLPANHFTGTGYGAGVTPGTNKPIVWDAGADYGSRYSTSMRVKITADDGSNPTIPPDPQTVATPPSNGVVSLLLDSTAFLYTGGNPIQSGVSAGTISTTQVAILRGQVLDVAGNGLSGAVISVNSHPEFGWTVSRTNGFYDMAVNGDKVLNLNLRKTGYLPVQRTLTVPWQDYVIVDDVVMITADTNVTVLAMPCTNLQVATGGTSVDERGSRRPSLMVPPGVTASILTYQGQTQQVGSLTTRFTEFTVGSNGPSAMPGDLPASVAYTYCVCLGADEAQMKVAGRDVLFSSPVYYYLDNFLGLPPGLPAPYAYYDNDAGAWVPEPDGRVIQLLGTNAAGLARISLDTNGVEADAATLAALGFSDAERAQLAAIHAPATNSLWRVPLTHFSYGDINLPTCVLDLRAFPPTLAPKPDQNQPVGNPDKATGFGVIETENQVFRESVPLVGMPFSLHYSSFGTPGYINGLTVPLTDTNPPAPLRLIRLEINVAGRTFTNEFAPGTNLSYAFSWDGKDAYGRTLEGRQPVSVYIGYVYDTYYAVPNFYTNSFGYPAWRPVPGNIQVPKGMTMGQSYQTTIGPPPSTRNRGIGGWTLGVHHAYDPQSKTLFLGNGDICQAMELADFRVIDTVAGNGSNSVAWPQDEGAVATNTGLLPAGLAVAQDNTLYISDAISSVRHVAQDGRIYWITGIAPGFGGDGGPATSAQLNQPNGIAIGPDGSLYIADTQNHRIRCIGTNGIIRTVAGNGVPAFSGDGGPATNASINSPYGVAVDKDGTLYISDTGNHRIRRVAPDGVIRTLAGNGATTAYGNGGAATNAGIGYPYHLVCDAEGNVTFADWFNYWVRRVNSSGIISLVAGGGGSAGNGIPATQAYIRQPYGLALAADNTLFISQNYYNDVRRITTAGILTAFAGNGTFDPSRVQVGDGQAAASAQLHYPMGLAVGQDGSVYIADNMNYRVRRVSPSMPGVGDSDLFIPSPDGAQIFIFTANGRHKRTLQAWTGATLYEFGYSNGCLTSVTDGDGNFTSIERDAAGKATALVSPYNQRSTMTLNADGFLETLTDPAGMTNRFAYTSGLLTAVVGPNGASCTYSISYDEAGRVTRAGDPAGGFTALGKTSWSNGYEVLTTSALGRVTSARVNMLPTGDRLRTFTDPDGSQATLREYIDGQSSKCQSDGRVLTQIQGADPRFGIQTPIVSCSVLTMPSGLSATSGVSRSVLTSTNIFQLTAMTNDSVVNANTTRLVYAESGRRVTLTSQEGRQMRRDLDSLGRVVSEQAPGLEAIVNTFDSRGRLASRQVGARLTVYRYDSNGFVNEVVDPMGRTNRMEHDAAGRITNSIRPDGIALQYTFDANGNLTALTPPGRPAHTLASSPVDMITNYTAPGGAPVVTVYNADRQVVSIDKGGQTTFYDYNAAGQLSNTRLAEDEYVWTYLANGMISSLSTTSGVSIAWKYDGTLLTNATWSGAINTTIAFAYDANFQKTSMRVGSQEFFFGYDRDGMLTNAAGCDYNHHPGNGLLVGSAMGVVTDQYQINGYGEVTNYTAWSNGTPAYGYACEFNTAGRRTRLVETLFETVTTNLFGYDLAGRLTSAVHQVGGGAITTNTYAYDSNGCRTNWVLAGVTNNAINDAQDRLVETHAALLTNSYSFSPAGALTNVTANGTGVTSYAYDAQGALRRAMLPAGGPMTNIQYWIDPAGRRVGRLVDGGFTNGWVYSDSLSPVAELAPDGVVTSVFIYGRFMHVPDVMIKGGIAYRLITDSLGSVRLVMRADNGQVVQRMDFDEWGRTLANTAPGFQPFGFAGGLVDADTGLIRCGARDYDPSVGRWTARDPVLFAGGGPNLYMYAGNDPVNSGDPSGLGPNQRYALSQLMVNYRETYWDKQVEWLNSKWFYRKRPGWRADLFYPLNYGVGGCGDWVTAISTGFRNVDQKEFEIHEVYAKCWAFPFEHHAVGIFQKGSTTPMLIVDPWITGDPLVYGKEAWKSAISISGDINVVGVTGNESPRMSQPPGPGRHS